MKTTPATVDHRNAIRTAAQPDRKARCGSLIPSAWPTSALAAPEKPMHGRKEKLSTWLTIWCAADDSVPRRNAKPDSARMPMLKSALSAADGRLIENSARMSLVSRPHVPPRIVRSARPIQSR